MGCNHSSNNDATPVRRLLAAVTTTTGRGVVGGDGFNTSGKKSSSSTSYNHGHSNSNNSPSHTRIVSIDETCTATFGGVSVRYAYLSQRGYYPDDMHKPNQDAFVAQHNFANRPTDAFFGVFDGHGYDGDKCAQFVRDNLPKILAEGIAKASSAQEEFAKQSFSSSGDGNALLLDNDTNLQQPDLVATSSLSFGLSKESTHEIIIKSHNECQRQMRTSPHLDDSLSGTTSISVYLHGHRNRITISNVGDSRAVVGRLPCIQAKKLSENNGDENGPSRTATMQSRGNASTSILTKNSITTLKAYALSRDQTPHRRDERVRIRKTGARILSLDQIEGLEPIDKDDAEHDEEKWLMGARKGGDGGEMVLGEELDEGGDPPRVWHPHGDYPGTAFTRSIGDSVAEELGVISDPEMITRNLTPEDKIIVLASDGVFEFLTNQSVIDICAKFADPLEACRAVVAESYELWLQYELRTDDITMICIFIDEVDSNKALTVPPSSFVRSNEPSALRDGSVEEKITTETDDELVNDGSIRPLRTNMSSEKRRALIKSKSSFNSSADDSNGVSEEDFEITSIYHEKTDEEKLQIDDALRGHLVFQNITDIQRELLYKVLVPMQVKKGEWVIRQGSHGDHFYIVDEGAFEVRILPDNAQDDEIGGDCVHVYEGSRETNSHPSFGELALKYSAPRAASIIARSDGQLWALHRHAFKKIIEVHGRVDKTTDEQLQKEGR